MKRELNERLTRAILAGYTWSAWEKRPDLSGQYGSPEALTDKGKAEQFAEEIDIEAIEELILSSNGVLDLADPIGAVAVQLFLAIQGVINVTMLMAPIEPNIPKTTDHVLEVLSGIMVSAGGHPFEDIQTHAPYFHTCMVLARKVAMVFSAELQSSNDVQKAHEAVRMMELSFQKTAGYFGAEVTVEEVKQSQTKPTAEA